MGDLWAMGQVITFAQLQKQYQLAPTEHFRYHQIKHALEATIPPNTTLPQASPLEDRLLTDYLDKRAISLTYKKIINHTPDPTGKLKVKWQTDVGELDGMAGSVSISERSSNYI